MLIHTRQRNSSQCSFKNSIRCLRIAFWLLEKGMNRGNLFRRCGDGGVTMTKGVGAESEFRIALERLRRGLSPASVLWIQDTTAIVMR